MAVEVEEQGQALPDRPKARLWVSTVGAARSPQTERAARGEITYLGLSSRLHLERAKAKNMFREHSKRVRKRSKRTRMT